MVSFFQCFFDIEFAVVWQSHTIQVVQAIQFSDSLCSTFRTIATVIRILCIVADKSCDAFLVLIIFHARDAAKLRKQGAHIFLCKVFREVLGVDVVKSLLIITILRLVFDNLANLCLRIQI